MPYFKTYTHAINMSQNDIKLHLSSITKQSDARNSLKKSKTIYKGKIEKDTFIIQRKSHYSLLRLHGILKKTEQGTTVIKIDASLILKYVILNGILFMTIFSVLTFLSVLMIQVNTLEGLFALSFTLLIGFGLFRNLLGRLRENYQTISSELIQTLEMVSSLNQV